MKKVIFIIFTLLSSSCSIFDENTDQVFLAKEHSIALSKFKGGLKKSSCSIFTNLSKNDRFLLKSLALIRSWETCSHISIRKSILRYWQGVEEGKIKVEPWLKELYLKISLKVAKGLKSRKEQGLFLLLSGHNRGAGFS